MLVMFESPVTISGSLEGPRLSNNLVPHKVTEPLGSLMFSLFIQADPNAQLMDICTDLMGLRIFLRGLGLDTYCEGP